VIVEEEYMRNLLRVLETLETVTREIILLQELAERKLGSDWRDQLEPLREDPLVQQEVTKELAWIVEARQRLQDSLRKLEHLEITPPPGSSVN
jgi:hypothetical protein